MDVSPSNGGIVELDQTALSPYPVTFNFRSGESAHLKAVPAPGYQFDNWSGNLSGTTNPVTVVVDCDKEITANFSPTVHILTMQSSGSGSTIPPVGDYSYSGGTIVSITALPDSGWQFDSWTGDVAEPSSVTTTITMDSDKAVTANFSPVKASWLLTTGIIGGVIVVGMIVWLAVRSRAT